MIELMEPYGKRQKLFGHGNDWKGIFVVHSGGTRTQTEPMAHWKLGGGCCFFCFRSISDCFASHIRERERERRRGV